MTISKTNKRIPVNSKTTRVDRLDWNRLICDVRMKPSIFAGHYEKADADYRSEYDADSDRIVYSTAFRRLAKKTQVHPLTWNDHVHQRLSHSLEVASVGRSFGHRLARHLSKDLPTGGVAGYLPSIMHAACLAHDIGNTPFGHAGEYAMREWCKSHMDEIVGKPVSDANGIKAGKLLSAMQTKALQDDIQLFDGNAQGFRLMVRSDNSTCGYMRLTYSTVAATVKYPWTCSEAIKNKLDKANIFNSEALISHEIFSTLGLQIGSRLARHPLSYFVEAADDICYKLIDIEDAKELSILSDEKVKELFKTVARREGNIPIPQLRGMAIRSLMRATWDAYTANERLIMNGELEGDLFGAILDPYVKGAIRDIKSITTATIFSSRSKLAWEIGAYKIIGRVAKALFRSVAELSIKGGYDKSQFISKKCLDLAWGKRFVALP